MAIKTFAWIELILGALVVLIPLLWCYVLPAGDINHLVWILVALGLIIAIVAAYALLTKPKHP